MSSRIQVLQLYKAMLRKASEWPNYNYRSYTLRKIKHTFRENKSLPQDQISDAIQKGQESLALIQRQVLIGFMYRTNELVIENTQH